MKKNFLTVLAALAAVLLVSVATAQAANFSFSGQEIIRAEDIDVDRNDDNASNSIVRHRMRLNVKADVNDTTGAFLQLHNYHVWGDATNAADNEYNVGLHQGYMTLKNVFGTGFNGKFGRQVIALDGHRLIGSTGWRLEEWVHDAFVFNNPSMDLTYVFSIDAEQNNQAAMATEDGTNEDIYAHVLRKGLDLGFGPKAAAYWIIYDDRSGSGNTFFHTVGLRQAGKQAGYDYRVEGYYQFGDYNAVEQGAGQAGSWTTSSDMDAYMFGVRVGKKIDAIPLKPKVTLWYDYLSGNDDDAANNNDWEQFHTLFDTGHKFYGFIDRYLDATGDGTDHMGLQDFAVKTAFQVAPGWTMKVDYHHFFTAEEPGNNQVAFIGGGETFSDANTQDMGEEIDITLKHKYNANVGLQFGYSRYQPTPLYQSVQATAAAMHAMDWMYGQIVLNF